MPTSNKRQHNLKLGRAGENQASQFLQTKGFQIWEQNYRHGQDEIDLIAFDQAHQEIVFVEVKTRTHDYAGGPSLAVDQRKLQAQTRAATHYLHQHPSSYDYRFDLIAILPDSIEHFENITWP